MSILPSFDEFPTEGGIVGKLVVGFGEIEFLFAVIAASALEDLDTMLRAVYSARTISGRITLAAELTKPKMEACNLEAEFALAHSITKTCLSLRNQYAHCHWAHQKNAGLFFTDLEEAAQRAIGFSYFWKHIDKPLLQNQERYFDYAKDFMIYLDHEYLIRAGRKQAPGSPRPQEQPPPTPHNPASQHIPPWLTEDDRRRHVERAQEAERAASPKERPPSVLRLTEDEWRAKDASERRSD